MQSDFHFYAMDHKEQQMTIAQEIVQHHIPTNLKTSSSEDEEMDPYLGITCLNEWLTKCWEQENPQVRSEYFAKEEEDWRRFMTEDEIVSQHCRTLTARSKNPKTMTVTKVEGNGVRGQGWSGQNARVVWMQGLGLIWN